MPNEKAVRRLWLVGESLPLTKANGEKFASKTSQLDDRLVCLDPRHGVFPNLVMKPLFAATYAAFKERDENALTLLGALEAVVCDKPDRRFNLFKPRITDQENPLSDTFAFDNENLRRLTQAFNVETDLWLIFGHQTVSGILKWLLEGEADTTRDELKRFLVKVVDAAKSTGGTLGFQAQSPTSATGRVGFVHRLCTEFDPDGSGAVRVLCNAVESLNTSQRFPNDYIATFIRCTVPLMHIEAYQDGSNPIGNVQCHFVRSATATTPNGDLYWQVMGHAIARRCFNRWVGEPN